MSGVPAGFVKAGLETRDGEWVPVGKKRDGTSFNLAEINRWHTLGQIVVRREKHRVGHVVFIHWKRR